jgi:molybdate transport system ATP-binding protein
MRQRRAPADADVVLEVDVEVARGQRAPFLVRAHFVVPAGITVLFGASGCGKTTVLEAIAGVRRPRAGSLRLGSTTWCDVAVGRHLAPQQRGVSLVFQSLALFPHMSALENVAFGIDRRLAAPEREARARAMLERMAAAHLADRRPATYSGGEAQRVALARAFARDPRVLLLDEPFSALDLPLRARLAQDVRRFVDERRIPAIYVTHDVGEAMTIADLAVVMEAGTVVRHGAPLDVLPHPVVD